MLIQNKLIKQAVKKLKSFGFINVTKKNLQTDDVYKQFYKKMLLLNLGRNKKTDKVIYQLLGKIVELTDINKEPAHRFPDKYI